MDGITKSGFRQELLEHISKIGFDENHDTSQINESEIVFEKAIIANQDSAVVLQLGAPLSSVVDNGVRHARLA